MEFNEKLFYTLHSSPHVRRSISVIKFPGGEVNVNVNTGSLSYDHGEVSSEVEVNIEARISSMDDLMALFLATDALRRVYANSDITLFIPYFPYARQDRVCNEGEALSVAVIAKLINAQHYDSVIVVDPHSAVTPAVIERCLVWDQYDVFGELKDDWGDWTIVAPDMGASKKAEDFAKRVGAKGIVYCNKSRELSTGKITGMSIVGGQELVFGGNLLILDDLCDKGGTFIGLEKCLRQWHPLTVELAVTHGLFTHEDGAKPLTDIFDAVFTSDSYHGKGRTEVGVTYVNL